MKRQSDKSGRLFFLRFWKKSYTLWIYYQWRAVRKTERLDKLLAGTGRWSRKEARVLVKEGRVSVDGVSAASPEQKLDPARDRVLVDGEALELGGFTYVMLHKPPGVLSATEDARQRTVLDLLSPELRRRGLFPVGRLDKDISTSSM